MKEDILFSIVRLEKNVGHGNARRISFDHCSNDLVALMDTDDISRPCRFEKQLKLFEQNPELSAVGGQIAEFEGEEGNYTGVRAVPLSDEEIKRFIRRRCPMNQVTVMLRKQDVQRAGGYQDWPGEEDYYLWLRMTGMHMAFANVPDILVDVRVGQQMIERRGGWSYYRSEQKMQQWMLQNHVISWPRYCFNVGIRFGAEVLASPGLRNFLYRFVRKPAVEVKGPEKGKRQKAKTPFSVAMCVYAGDQAAWFDKALESVIEQTAQPQQIVLVVDGPVPEAINAVIEKYRRRLREA